MDADGTDETRITHNQGADFQPSFSPDGKKIVFASNRAGADALHVMNVDGTDQTPLTHGRPRGDHVPVFAPDGTKIAFTRADDHAVGQIYVMDADGGDVIKLTSGGSNKENPSFSPDGKMIAFATFSGRSSQIFTMRASDGSDKTNVSKGSARERSPRSRPAA